MPEERVMLRPKEPLGRGQRMANCQPRDDPYS